MPTPGTCACHISLEGDLRNRKSVCFSRIDVEDTICRAPRKRIAQDFFGPAACMSTTMLSVTAKTAKKTVGPGVYCSYKGIIANAFSLDCGAFPPLSTSANEKPKRRRSAAAQRFTLYRSKESSREAYRFICPRMLRHFIRLDSRAGRKLAQLAGAGE